jgi:DNA-directed RNA polymerase alpha subunit
MNIDDFLRENITRKGYVIRIGNALAQLGVKTTDDLYKISKKDVFKVKNFGMNSYYVLFTAMYDNGIHFKPEICHFCKQIIKF